jgi:hypothetical protein
LRAITEARTWEIFDGMFCVLLPAVAAIYNRELRSRRLIQQAKQQLGLLNPFDAHPKGYANSSKVSQRRHKLKLYFS